MAADVSPQMAQGVLDLSGDVDALADPLPVDALRGNALGGLEGLLASFGVAATQERDAVEDVVTRELERLGHEARMVRLRYATLHLEASAQSARFLQYDVPALLEALRVAVPGRVERVAVRVASPVPRTRAHEPGFRPDAP